MSFCSPDMVNDSHLGKDEIVQLLKNYTILGIEGSTFYKPLCDSLCNEMRMQLLNHHDCVTLLQYLATVYASSINSTLQLKSMLGIRIQELFQMEEVMEWDDIAYDLLEGMSHLRLRKRALLDRLLAAIEKSFPSEQNWKKKIQMAFHLYSLDIWNASLMDSFLVAITTCPDDVFALDINPILRLFLSFAYFSMGDTAVWDMLLQQILPREIQFDRNSLEILKMIEISLRVGHFSFSTASLSRSSRDFLLRIRILKTHLNSEQKKLPCSAVSFLFYLESTKISHWPIEETNAMQKEMLDAALFLSFDVYSGVALGPYFLDFVKPLTTKEIDNLEQRYAFQSRLTCAEKSLDSSNANTATNLINNGIILEAAIPSFFYDSTTIWTAQSKWKHALLTGLGMRYVRIPFFEWERLSTKLEKSAFVKHMLDEACDI
ncbi:RAP domain-containing protein [Cardiosporidium cionae]|uniref:RAP domain-containing protein n=1 Tax=Cardiosporidium cionae TaxID=476202 RepID=A0ABQ7JB96_9APIC|nr:RAP domain-containing protein [Cardiosporidium cionae]|eukprot:KAF8820930.1 RAP domain-containing protein [Cardiosporidium cionae]